MMPKLYYRVQPSGISLTHTSESSAGKLPKGYVFVYKSPVELISAEAWDWIRQTTRSGIDLEVVELFGSSEYDPGDFEGVAVIPTTIRRRKPLMKWLWIHGFIDEYEEISTH